MNELVPVITGFFLTTVLGGLLGFWLQNRSWAHQHKILVAEQEHQHKILVAEQKREKAVQIFDEISRLMDKRLYRLRLIYWELADEGDQANRSPSTESRWEDYRQVLYEWNDNINRNLALLQRYFGQEMRNRLDNGVGLSFVMLGRVMEQWSKSGEPATTQSDVESRLKNLSNLVYAFNVDMIRAIQSEVVGSLILENR